jgi:hypothetical protein
MELLYVNKVHCYFEIFQKILNSQIVPKIAKWIWKTELEKTFGKKSPSLFGPNLAHLPFFPFLTEAQQRPSPTPSVQGLPPFAEAARWQRLRRHLAKMRATASPPPSDAYKYPKPPPEKP